MVFEKTKKFVDFFGDITSSPEVLFPWTSDERRRIILEKNTAVNYKEFLEIDILETDIDKAMEELELILSIEKSEQKVA